MSAQYQHERQVAIVIDGYHRNAIRTEQLRMARSAQPRRLAPLMMLLRAAIGIMVNTSGAGRHDPAASREPVAAPTFTSELGDTVMSA